MPPNAVILLSGGLDSATALAIARQEGYHCHALTFDYGQRHCAELDAARRVAESLGVVEHQIVHIDLRAFGGSALTDDIAMPKHSPLPPGEGQGVRASEVPAESADSTDVEPAPLTPDHSPKGRGEKDDIPVTYVPARNTILLSFAVAYAETINACDIYIGVNAIDYSGYPDCRPDFIRAFEQMANLGTKLGVERARRNETGIRIHTPLIEMTKAQIIARGTELGIDFSITLSCYDPPPPPPEVLKGTATRVPVSCGECEACHLRAAGFREAGIADPAQTP